jgi:8-oxo-dGTP diphosphatase
VLHTWLVTHFEGTPHGREQQAFAWVRPQALHEWDLLGADGPIVNALKLPSHYVFTPPDVSLAWLLERLDRLPQGSLLRLRQPTLDDADYAARAKELLAACHARGLRLMLDRAPGMVVELGADGWHATEHTLRVLSARPLAADHWFAVSAHDRETLVRARSLSADLAVVGAVLPTATHPGSTTLQWSGFEAVTMEAGLPVYAIGGLGPETIISAYQNGAQGVAGISAYWNG